MTELERCGYRYYLERVLGLPEDRAAAAAEAAEAGGQAGLDARARGTLVHRLMESADFARPRSISPEQVARVASELGVRASRSERAEIAQLVATACTAAPATRVAAARSLRREHPFAFSPGAGAPLITGVIDLLALEGGGGYLVVDYKSDRVAADTDLAELVQREYALQRELYALALLRGPAVAGVEVLHWFLERPTEWVSVRYDANDRDELERRLRARLARLDERAFDVSPSPHRGLCMTCPGRASLCSWSDAETLRKNPC